jgi:RHS repeat-associated protein
MEEITGDGTSLWSCTDVNALGQVTAYSQGTYSTTKVFDDYGRLTRSTTNNSVMDMEYDYTDAGNMEYRKDLLTNQKEVFSYDNLNRLTDIEYYLSATHIPAEDFALTYDNGGNITSNSDIGTTMSYGSGNAGPHALTSIEHPLSLYEPPTQSITYTGFDKVSVIEDTDDSNVATKLEFSYGLGNQRIKTVQSIDDVVEKTKYFHGDYEEETIGTNTKKYHYISSPTGLTAIFVEEGTTNTMYHVATDHLGSISAVINAATDQVQKYSYSAWGIPRSNSDWTTDFSGDLFADRGFTGHEHLQDFDLINMNGRVYDPEVGRFLSPDPFVQAPGYANSFNRYAYVLNNPLMYTDPSGYTNSKPNRELDREQDQRYRDNLGRGWPTPNFLWRADNSREEAWAFGSNAMFLANRFYNSENGNDYWHIYPDGTISTGKTMFREYQDQYLDIVLTACSNEMQYPKMQVLNLQKKFAKLLRNRIMLTPFLINPFMGAEAIIFDIGAGIGGSETDGGFVLMLVGNEIGKIRFMTELAGGGGSDGGINTEVTRIDYYGAIRNFSLLSLDGYRQKTYVNVSPFGEGPSIGVAYTWSVDVHGANIRGYTIQGGIGGGIIPFINGGYNEGNIRIYEK